MSMLEFDDPRNIDDHRCAAEVLEEGLAASVVVTERSRVEGLVEGLVARLAESLVESLAKERRLQTGPA